MASRRHSPLVGQTWHSSIPVPISTVPPNGKGFSPVPNTVESLIPPGDCSWSGDWKNLFADSNSSDWHGQSAASTASWSDELENESSQRLSDQYEQIETALYGDSCSLEKLSNPNLVLECKQWKERFPHMRAVGVGIRETLSSDVASTETECCGEEEVIAADGNYEEVPEQQPSIIDDNNRVYSPGCDITEEDIEKYKEKVKKTVLDQIFSQIWPNIIKKIDPVFKKIIERNKLAVQVPPKVYVENDTVEANNNNVELRFTDKNKFLSVSQERSRESSAKKSSCPSSPIPVIKSSVVDCSVSQVAPINIRNSSSAVKNSSSIKLGQPPHIIFPSAEKLLSPITLEARNILQSARIRKKLLPKSGCPSGKTKPNQQLPSEQDQEERRFCSKDEGRSGVQFGTKKITRGYWNRHGMLPPISSKENIKTLSAATLRSTSALQNLGKPDLETRPNTSVPNKNGITLLPLNQGNKKKSRMDLAQEWLEKQLSSSGNGKQHLSTQYDPASRWRAHHLSHRK